MDVSSGTFQERLTIDKYNKRSKENPRSMAKAIRAHCVECSGGLTAEVRECVIVDCALYPFRMGKRP